jgi:hypothetical protein
MVEHAQDAHGPWVIQGLGADGPDPALQEKLMLFGQFVGDWTIEARHPQPDGTEIRNRGTLHMRWILAGRAVQDVWVDLQGDPPREVPAGTTLRFYDPKIDAWQCIWLSPVQGVVRTFVARKVGDEIVLEGHTADGHPEHWVFSEITPEAFRWRAEISHKNTKEWQLIEEMRVRRAATMGSGARRAP